MNRFRFSISTFLIVVTLLGLGLGAMAAQSAVAVSLAYTMFVSLVCLAAAVAIAPQSRTRGFCTGFAIFGAVYWLVEFRVPDRAGGPQPAGWAVAPPRRGEPFEPTFITRELIHVIEQNLSPRRTAGTRVMAAWNNNGRYYPATIVQESGGQIQIQWVDGNTLQWTPAGQVVGDSLAPLVAGHALMGGLFALGGGVLTMILSGKPKADAPAPSNRET